MRICLFTLALSVSAFAGDLYKTGIIHPRHDVSLSVALDGKLTSLLVEEGQKVIKGEKILQLDDTLQKFEVARRKLAWEDLSQLKAMKENLILLKVLVANKEKLFKESQAISQSELTRANIQLNKLVGEYHTLMALKAKEKLEFEIASKIRESYFILSPIAGEVVDLKPSVGEWVKLGAETLRVVDTAVCYLEVNVDLETVGQLRRQPEKVHVRVKIGEEILRKKA
ncbi:MAG: HlyD family efflux transporter periplasmic adaptor subunit, partial [Lentisphaeraceae bacterium]|nr:HlyD family efflux transporter periplasmic adaptor subunit [Lentisphaeraceae bacterium]